MNEKTLSRLCKLIFENDLQTIKQNLGDNESIPSREKNGICNGLTEKL